ncbi:MAG: EamA family transporter [Anaerolineales bacterium]
MSDITVASRLLSARGTAGVGWAIALASTLAFSVAPPITKAAIDLGLNPTLLLMLRFLITTVLLSGTVTFTAPRGLALARRGLLISIGVGLITGIGMLAFFWSLTRINASVASMIFSLYPLGVLGLLALRGEKFTYRNTIRLALGLGGARRAYSLARVETSPGWACCWWQSPS